MDNLSKEFFFILAGDVDTEATTTNHGEEGHHHEPPGSPTPGPSTQKGIRIKISAA